MSNACQYDAEFILGEFKDSLNYLWFSHLSDGLIRKVIDSILKCPEAKSKYENCNGLFCCWIIEVIAVTLNALGITEQQGEGGPIPVIPAFDESPVVSHVKKDVVRDESREYFKPEIEPCKDCGDFPLGRVKANIRKYEEICKNSQSLLGGVGTDYGCRKSSGGCLKDEYKI